MKKFFIRGSLALTMMVSGVLVGSLANAAQPLPLCSSYNAQQCVHRNHGLDRCELVSGNCVDKTPVAICGNGITETGEQCDDGEDNTDMVIVGYDETVEYCSTTCLDQVAVGPYCGDDVTDDDFGEECDGEENCDDTCTLIDTCTDLDNDGICDAVDNCPSVANADQLDSDNDGVGDVCDRVFDCDKFKNQTSCEGGAAKDTCMRSDDTCINIPACEPTNNGVEICDGLDNNCNGNVDENLAMVVTNCAAGVGACFVEGTVTDTCIEGILSEGECTAVAGVPMDEVCDDIDNDCDGDVNEGLMCEPEMCPETSNHGPYLVSAVTHSPTAPLATVMVNIGDEVIVTSATDDTWSAGADDRTSNADGLTAENTYGGNYGLFGEFPYGALVGRIGNDGTWFFIGTNETFIASTAGELQLAYRDSAFDDNSGDVSVSITRNYEVECPYEPVCGNGILDKGEDERCDGFQDEYEDARIAESNGYCNASCEWVEEVETYCGDGIVNNEEQCDDGNENNTDRCSTECLITTPTGGGQASSVGGSTPAGPQTLLETGPEGNVPTEATAETVIAACEEDTYILERLGKLKKLSMEIVEVIPSKYARKIGTKAIKLMNQLSSMLRKTTDKEVKNDHIRALVCKIEIMKEARGLRHKNIGAKVNGNEVDYLLQYLQDLAILQFKK